MDSDGIEKAENSKSEEIKNIVIPKNLKQGVLDKLIEKGNLIAKYLNLSKLVWEHIYKCLLVFPFVIFIGLVISLVSFQVKFLSFVEMLNYLLTIILSITAYIGIEKMKKKNLQNWKEVNVMIYIMGGITGITILSSLFPILSGSIAVFIYAYRFCVFLFYSILGGTLYICYYLNIEMNTFYNEYIEEEKSGQFIDNDNKE